MIGLWLVLTVFGAFSAAKVSNRWLEQFSIPGYSAYEANQRTLKDFGTGEQAPLVAVFHLISVSLVSVPSALKTTESRPIG